ncbi:ferridoxin [Deltaproteobacteria bacterium Smac51]|nr:ferridoxin [Deltaproteobacteria bacterium Smac51]
MTSMGGGLFYQAGGCRMPLFTVDERCIQCGLCSELCVARIIKMNDGEGPEVLPEDEEKCITCGQCVSFCPTSACFLDIQPLEDRIEVLPELMPSAEIAETFLRSRRSVRRYKSESVDESLVHRIIETCRYAPTASNSQLVRWVVTSDREQTKKLGGMVVDTFRGMLSIDIEEKVAHMLGAVVRAWDAGHDVIFRTAPHLAVAVFDRKHTFQEDAAIALTYFELAAHANEIGCCWAGFFTTAARQSSEIQKFLGVGENEMIVGGQMFGYPSGLGLSHILPPRKKASLTWI